MKQIKNSYLNFYHVREWLLSFGLPKKNVLNQIFNINIAGILITNFGGIPTHAFYVLFRKVQYTDPRSSTNYPLKN